MKLALEWWKDTSMPGARGIDLKASDIPEDIDLDVKLDVSLPQDKLQQSNIAISLANTGMTSKEWVRENVLNIGQSDQMETDIWDEQAAAAMYQMYIQQQLQQMQMQQQQMQQQQMMMQQQPQQGQGMPMPQQQQAQPPQGMPPDEMEMMG